MKLRTLSALFLLLIPSIASARPIETESKVSGEITATETFDETLANRRFAKCVLAINTSDSEEYQLAETSCISASTSELSEADVNSLENTTTLFIATELRAHTRQYLSIVTSSLELLASAAEEGVAVENSCSYAVQNSGGDLYAGDTSVAVCSSPFGASYSDSSSSSSSYSSYTSTSLTSSSSKEEITLEISAIKQLYELVVGQIEEQLNITDLESMLDQNSDGKISSKEFHEGLVETLKAKRADLRKAIEVDQTLNKAKRWARLKLFDLIYDSILDKLKTKTTFRFALTTEKKLLNVVLSIYYLLLETIDCLFPTGFTIDTIVSELKKADSDGDGALSESEIQAAFGKEILNRIRHAIETFQECLPNLQDLQPESE